MITAKEIKIRIPDEITGIYIENELKKTGLDVLKWSITNSDSEYYTLNLAIVEN